VEKLAVNPSGVSGSGAVIVDSRELEWGEYVIIATQAYAAKAQELADWKTAKGIPSSVITTDWISSTYTGCDLQQKMRAFLTDARDQGVEFVLIYGDDDVVPCRDGLLGYYSGPEIAPVDMYFSDINDLAPGADLWDSNGNDIWCEYGFDIVDYHPDLWVGRASVNTMDECDIFNEGIPLRGRS